MQHDSTRSRLLWLFALVAALTLLVAACGDDDSGTSDPGGTDSPSSDDGDDSADDGVPDDADDDTPSDRSDELIGAWTITTYQLAGAAGEASPVGDNPATIEFADGTVAFSTGCNTGEGEWETYGAYQPANDEGIPEGQPISFGPLGRTEIDCEPELFDQDLAIGGAIRAADVFIFDDDVLTLWRDGNLMIEAEAS